MIILTMLYLQFREYCVIILCDKANNKAEIFYIDMEINL